MILRCVLVFCKTELNSTSLLNLFYKSHVKWNWRSQIEELKALTISRFLAERIVQHNFAFEDMVDWRGMYNDDGQLNFVVISTCTQSNYTTPHPISWDVCCFYHILLSSIRCRRNLYHIKDFATRRGFIVWNDNKAMYQLE